MSRQPTAPPPISDSTARFSSRVDTFVRYRPHYPIGVIELLQRDCGLTSAAVIAVMGSGTGILSELFLAAGYTVIGVEPNAPMRHAAESLLSGQPRFQSVDGTAEHSTLPVSCADFVAVNFSHTPSPTVSVLTLSG